MSSFEGVGSPDGWLCTRTRPQAPSPKGRAEHFARVDDGRGLRARRHQRMHQVVVLTVEQDDPEVLAVAVAGGEEIPGEVSDRARDYRADAGMAVQIPGPPSTWRAVLERQLAQTREIEKATGRIIPWLFHRRGRPIKSFRRAWQTACEKAGVGQEHPYEVVVRNLPLCTHAEVRRDQPLGPGEAALASGDLPDDGAALEARQGSGDACRWPS
jgi:hypothetical protein